MGILGWSPETFWSSTPYELGAAMDGYLERTGARKRPGMTRKRFEELMKEYPD